MRDGSTRRPSTSSRLRPWTPDRIQVQHWRERHRHAVLQGLADGSQGVAWTRRLLNVLLEELHVTDEFDQLVGPTSRLPASQYPRLRLQLTPSRQDAGAAPRATPALRSLPC